MFIVACFSRETRNTTATTEEVTTLAKSNRRVRNTTREAIATVTAMANQNRAAIGSVRNNKTSVATSSANALATAITRCVLAPGIVRALGAYRFLPAPMSSYCHNAAGQKPFPPNQRFLSSQALWAQHTDIR
jgi:hypothetical protein